MWRTPLGDRVLQGAEAKLFATVVHVMVDEIVVGMDDENLRMPSGVPAFDSLGWMQQLALLAEVTEALFRPDIPTPEHTSVNESAIAAVFHHLWQNVEFEIDCEGLADAAAAETWRESALAALDEVEGLWAAARPETAIVLADDETLLTAECDDMDEWSSCLHVLQDAVLWDNDWAFDDEHLDAPPEQAAEACIAMDIDPEYFRAIPPDPRESDLDAILNRLQAVQPNMLAR
jgi:hypothetical protein